MLENWPVEKTESSIRGISYFLTGVCILWQKLLITTFTSHIARQGGHKVGEKNSLSFPGFSIAINLLFRSYRNKKVTRQLATTNNA